MSTTGTRRCEAGHIASASPMVASAEMVIARRSSRPRSVDHVDLVRLPRWTVAVDNSQPSLPGECHRHPDSVTVSSGRNRVRARRSAWTPGTPWSPAGDDVALRRLQQHVVEGQPTFEGQRHTSRTEIIGRQHGRPFAGRGDGPHRIAQVFRGRTSGAGDRWRGRRAWWEPELRGSRNSRSEADFQPSRRATCGWLRGAKPTLAKRRAQPMPPAGVGGQQGVVDLLLVRLRDQPRSLPLAGVGSRYGFGGHVQVLAVTSALMPGPQPQHLPHPHRRRLEQRWQPLSTAAITRSSASATARSAPGTRPPGPASGCTTAAHRTLWAAMA